MNSDTVKSIRSNMLLTNIILLVVGLSFVIWPDKASDMFVRVLGGILIACAVFEIGKFLIEKKKGMGDIVTIIGGIIVGAVGVFFMIDPAWLVGMMGLVFGIIVILIGLLHLHQSLFIIKAVRPMWWISLIISFCVIILGILICTNPFGLVNGIFVFIGITLIIEAVAGFYNLPALKAKG